MKKLYLLIAALFSLLNIAQSQCVIDPGVRPTTGVYPAASMLPCIEVGAPYNQTIQGKIQQSADITFIILPVHVEVDSVSLDSIAGLPTGINWSKNPDVLLGGGNGCVQFTGSTNDPVGTYPLQAFGTAWLRSTSPFPFSRAVNGDLNRFSPFGGYYLRVINPGENCELTSAINDFSPELNSALTVYPNPSNGIFELKLNAGKRLNGEIVVVDVTGRNVFAQPLDAVGMFNTSIDLSAFAKGIYTVQVRTAEGFAAKTISVE